MVFKAIQTKNGGYLVIVNQTYGCYTDEDGSFRRSVDNIETEILWATDKWDNKEIIDFPHTDSLFKELQYVQEYKESLIGIES